MQCPNYTQLAQSFEAQGYTLTPKRKNVAEYVYEMKEFSTVEELWIALRGKQKVSFATVILSISLLKRLGYIEAIFSDKQRSKRYRWKQQITEQEENDFQ